VPTLAPYAPSPHVQAICGADPILPMPQIFLTTSVRSLLSQASIELLQVNLKQFGS
jgi:hypothetical protein